MKLTFSFTLYILLPSFKPLLMSPLAPLSKPLSPSSAISAQTSFNSLRRSGIA